MTEAMTTTMPQPHVLTALEAMPADLRHMLGWRRLFALALDAVMAVAPKAAHDSERTMILLTLATYCYASNLLASEDIEAACVADADVGYIVKGVDVSAVEFRQFRRHNRASIERCLQYLFGAALAEQPGNAHGTAEPSLTDEVSEFSRRRLNLAVLFDTAFNE
jgi:hypothetical protein